MPRYGDNDSHERTPLESPIVYENIYLQQSDPLYHDASPRRPPAASSSSFGRDHNTYDDPYDDAHAAPPPPPHGHDPFYVRGRPDAGHPRQITHNTITPGADNFSESAAGGVAGIAYGVAERNARNSGVEALHNNRNHYNNNYDNSNSLPPPPSHVSHAAPGPGNGDGNGYGDHADRGVHSSLNPLGMPAAAPNSRSPSRSPGNGEPYIDNSYQVYSGSSRNNISSLGIVNPNDIEDDGDDGLDYSKHSQRNSMLSASNSDRGAKGAVGAAAAVGGAAAAGGVVGGLLNRNAANNTGGGAVEYDLATGQEKSSAWLAKQDAKGKRWKWAIIIIIFLVIVGAIVGGVVGGLIGGSKSGGKSGGGSGNSNGGSSGDDSGDLNINSQEIQALLNNPNLHKVFPGVDYTPLNSQYPACLTEPPSQNNITRDVAVLSQLTNRIRLYGTDCNQTQMVLHSISQLEMTKNITVWMGIWQDNNDTTNARQLDQMWTILDQYGPDPFEGIIVANEVLYREQFTVTSLSDLLDSVRSNLTSKNINLPVATSDLGDDWTQALGNASDCIMANVHPFFSGTPADEAAAWTWDFWSSHDGPFWKSDKARNIISETGWPSGGGTDCGAATTCTNGSVAGIDEMNTFMADWVCQALANGTNYFWFEAFDEPWKVIYNTPGKEWEDKWGLMDANRNLKSGIQIPDCGGKTVDGLF